MYKGLDSAKPENLKVADKIANGVICLPIYPELKGNEVSRIIELIQER